MHELSSNASASPTAQLARPIIFMRGRGLFRVFDTSKVSRRQITLLIALVALLAWVFPGLPASAAATATLVAGTIVPHNPPMDGVVRLDLRVRASATIRRAPGRPATSST